MTSQVIDVHEELAEAKVVIDPAGAHGATGSILIVDGGTTAGKRV